MTEKEAIEIIRVERTCVERNAAKLNCDRDCGHCDLLKEDNEILEAYNIAISALEEIEKYRAYFEIQETAYDVDKVVEKLQERMELLQYANIPKSAKTAAAEAYTLAIRDVKEIGNDRT